MEGGTSDQELLDKIMKDMGYGPADASKDAGSTIDTSTADDALSALDGSTGSTGSTSQQPVDLDAFSSNVTTYLQNNPGSNNKISNLIKQLQSAGVNGSKLQMALSTIALSGGRIASALQGLKLNRKTLRDINQAINALDAEDKDIIKGLVE